jgi:hypothetical protein
MIFKARPSIWLALIFFLASGYSFGQKWEQVGKSHDLEFSFDGASRPKSDFDLPIVQGDRLRFKLTPIGEANMVTRIYVYLSGQGRVPYDSSHWGTSYDWTMSKIPSGSQIRVEVRSRHPGVASLTVYRAKATSSSPAADGRGTVTKPEAASGEHAAAQIDRLEAELEELRKDVATRIDRLQAELKDLKMLLDQSKDSEE